MAIELSVKSNYGGNLVSQKYQPVETPVLQAADKNDCLAFANARIEKLSSVGKLPRTLDFFIGEHLQAILAAEELQDSKPPLVVISSNRSSWIADGFARAAGLLEDLNLQDFTDVSDVRALAPRKWTNPGGHYENDPRPVPAWYHPKRVNDANRRVYVVVHYLEYGKYLRALSGVPNLYVIGWSFHNEPGWLAAEQYPYLGFGASRYAAIEFCKWLRVQSRKRWDFAWLVDDNLYYVNAFRGLVAAEAAMLARGYVGLSFGCATATDPTDGIFAKLKANKITGNPGGDYKSSKFTQDGVLQQAVLWNIAWLDQHHLNFSPYFLSSAEDTSLTNYLSFNKHAFGITTETTILKQEGAKIDDDDRGKILKNIRDRYEADFAVLANTSKVINKEGVATPVELGNFIVNAVFPKSQMPARATDAEYVNRAVCQAVESIMATAVKKAGFSPATLFQPNGNNPQTITHL